MRPEDRILHYALTRLLRGEERADLSGRVLRAWRESTGERDERPTSPDGASTSRPRAAKRGAPAGAPKVSGAPGWLLVAAGLAALVALGLYVRSRGPGEAETVASAEPGTNPEPGTSSETGSADGEDARAEGHPPAGPQVASPDSARARPALAEAPLARFDGSPVATLARLDPDALVRELRPGELVTVPTESPPVRVHLASGAVLTAWPEAVFSLAPPGSPAPSVRLAAGTARLAWPAGAAARTGATPRIDAGFAALAPLAGGVVLAHVESDDPSAPELGPQALAAAPGRARLFTAEVSAGLAELTTAAGVERVVERVGRTVASTSGQGSMAEDARTRIADLLSQIARIEEKATALPAAGGTDLAARERDEAERKLFEFLDERPTRWVLLAEVASSTLDERPRFYLTRVLDVLATAPHPRALATLRALWPEHGAAFGDELLIAIQGRGAREIDRELLARAAGWSPGEGAPPALAAAWFARRGDDVGRSALEAAAALDGFEPETLLARIHGALGLAALGEPAALEATIEALATSGLERVDAGALEAARNLAMTVDFLAPLDPEADPQAVPLTDFWERVDAHALAHPERFADAVAVNDALAARVPE